MRKIVLSIIMALLLTAGAAGCARTETSEEKESSVSEENQGTEEQTENETNGLAASDGAEMQTEDPEMPTSHRRRYKNKYVFWRYRGAGYSK